MSHMTLTRLATSETEPGPPAAASTPRKHAPVLIAENHVAFGAAAATPVGSSRRRWLDMTRKGGLGRILTAMTRPRPRYARRELAYLEAARMSRAMDRL
jgi:hypothetical protein